jgi:hypothetical protein
VKKNQRQALWGDAIEYGKKRLKCLEKLPESEANQRKIIEARTKLAGFYTAVSNFAPAIDLISLIISTAQEMNYQNVLPAIYVTKRIIFTLQRRRFRIRHSISSKGSGIRKRQEKLFLCMDGYLQPWMALLLGWKI